MPLFKADPLFKAGGLGDLFDDDVLIYPAISESEAAALIAWFSQLKTIKGKHNVE